MATNMVCVRSQPQPRSTYLARQAVPARIPKTLTFHVSVPCDCMGVLIVGQQGALGQWKKSISLNSCSSSKWSSPALTFRYDEFPLLYKFLVVTTGGLIWEDGDNRKTTLEEADRVHIKIDCGRFRSSHPHPTDDPSQRTALEMGPTCADAVPDENYMGTQFAVMMEAMKRRWIDEVEKRNADGTSICSSATSLATPEWQAAVKQVVDETLRVWRPPDCTEQLKSVEDGHTAHSDSGSWWPRWGRSSVTTEELAALLKDIRVVASQVDRRAQVVAARLQEQDQKIDTAIQKVVCLNSDLEKHSVSISSIQEQVKQQQKEIVSLHSQLDAQQISISLGEKNDSQFRQLMQDYGNMGRDLQENNASQLQRVMQECQALGRTWQELTGRLQTEVVRLESEVAVCRNLVSTDQEQRGKHWTEEKASLEAKFEECRTLIRTSLEQSEEQQNKLDQRLTDLSMQEQSEDLQKKLDQKLADLRVEFGCYRTTQEQSEDLQKKLDQKLADLRVDFDCYRTVQGEMRKTICRLDEDFGHHKEQSEEQRKMLASLSLDSGCYRTEQGETRTKISRLENLTVTIQEELKHVDVKLQEFVLATGRCRDCPVGLAALAVASCGLSGGGQGNTQSNFRPHAASIQKSPSTEWISVDAPTVGGASVPARPERPATGPASTARAQVRSSSHPRPPVWKHPEDPAAQAITRGIEDEIMDADANNMPAEERRKLLKSFWKKTHPDKAAPEAKAAREKASCWLNDWMEDKGKMFIERGST